MHELLLNRDIYDEVMLKRLPEARRFVWIVTADIKDLHLDTGHGFEPLLALLSRLIDSGVGVRLIHAKEPGPRFRQHFDDYPALINSELFERVLFSCAVSALKSSGVLRSLASSFASAFSFFSFIAIPIVILLLGVS